MTTDPATDPATDTQVTFRRIDGVVRCCRDWPVILQTEDGEACDWRKCGLCNERPVLVEIDGGPV